MILVPEQIKRLFPQYLLLNNDLMVIQTGESLHSILPNITGYNFYSIFEIQDAAKDRKLTDYAGKKVLLKTLHSKNKSFQAHIEHLTNNDQLFIVLELLSDKNFHAQHQLPIQTLTHAIGSPLTALQSTLDLLKKRQEMFSKEMALITNQYFKIAFNEILTIASILKNTGFLFSNSTLRISKTETDLVQLIYTLLESEFLSLYEKGKITVTQTGRNKLYSTDQNLMSLLICNLITEITKYTNGDSELTLNIRFTDYKTEINISNKHSTLTTAEFNFLSKSLENEYDEIISGKTLVLTAIKQLIQLHHATLEIKHNSAKNISFILKLNNGPNIEYHA